MVSNVRYNLFVVPCDVFHLSWLGGAHSTSWRPQHQQHGQEYLPGGGRTILCRLNYISLFGPHVAELDARVAIFLSEERMCPLSIGECVVELCAVFSIPSYYSLRNPRAQNRSRLFGHIHRCTHDSIMRVPVRLFFFWLEVKVSLFGIVR